MTPVEALSCPRCKRVLGPESWRDANTGRCFRCETEFECVTFPAHRAARAQVKPQAAVLAEDSVCFFHAENRAGAICESCGRLLCPVCAVPFGGQTLCPTCIATAGKSDAPTAVRDRLLWDALALAVAGLPILFVVTSPLTIGTAPIALGLVAVGWKKPGSLVRGRSRARFVFAAVLAVASIVGWFALFYYMPATRTRVHVDVPANVRKTK